MKVYLAGVEPKWKELAGHHVLVSYAEARQLGVIDGPWEPAGILLDSGAFTVWKKGAVVDLDAYCEYIHKRSFALDGYFALDVIQGTAEENLANLDAMEAAGCAKWGKLIPVFHEGDDPELLNEYIRRGYNLIGLGGTVSRGKPELADWLLPIFEKHPGQKFHGLAMTQRRLIKHFPFYSVDSSSWMNLQRFGLDGCAYMFRGLGEEAANKIGALALQDFAQRDTERMTPAVAREIGALLIEDIPRCPAEAPAAINGQARLFPTIWTGEDCG